MAAMLAEPPTHEAYRAAVAPQVFSAPPKAPEPSVEDTVDDTENAGYVEETGDTTE